MKTKLLTAISFLPLFCLAQGTMVFDQTSAPENANGEFANAIQSNQIIGQSFTPSLNGVGFIRLFTGDSSVNGVGATLYVNIRSGSISGSVIATSTPVFLPDGFLGRTNFFFATEVPVTPGTTYYFQPVVQSGDTWQIISDIGQNFSYPGGVAYFHGNPSASEDLWFREGVVVPEPSVAALVFLGAGLYWSSQRTSRCSK